MNPLPLVVLLLLRSAMVQDQWRLAMTDGSVQAAWGEPRLTAEERSRVRVAWTWSTTKAPRSVEVVKIGSQKMPEDAGRLTVQVARQAGSRPPADLRVVAAPISMWRDVPEHALPSWPVPKDGKLAIPYEGEERWRLRVAGTGEGSWWQDVPPGRTAVGLVSVAARGLEVRIAGPKGESVAPVIGTLREARSRQGQLRAWASMRGEDGRLSLPGLPDLNEVALSIVRGGFMPANVTGFPSELPGEIRLAAGAILAGRLLDEKRAPFSGAQVQAEAWLSPTTPSPFTIAVASDAEGRFRLAGLPLGEVVLRIQARGYAVLQDKVEVGPGTNDLGDRVLERGVTLPVRVFNDLGEPIAGARVMAGPALTAESDDSGIARLVGAPQAPLDIRGTAAGHFPCRVQLNPPLPAEARLELARAFTLRGRFLEKAGVPVSQGAIHVEQDTATNEERLADDGRFEIDLIPDERVQVKLTSPATAALSWTMRSGSPGEVRDYGDIVADPGLTLVGQIVDRDTGAPVPGAQVWMPRPGPSGPAVAWATRDLLQAGTDVDGRFRLSGLSAGTALLRVDAGGYARAHLEVPVSEEGETQDVGEIRLARGATLRVHVQGEDGEEAAGIVARADLRNGWLEPDMLIAEVREGTATFHHLPPGRATVSVLQGRRMLCEREVSIGPKEDEIDLDCRSPGMVVAGTVTVGTTKAGSGSLVWNRPAPPMPSRIDNVFSPGGLRHQEVVGGGRPATEVPVSGGGFATAELTSGRWEVSFLPAGGFPGPAQTVDIPAGDRFEINLAFAGTALAGRVVTRDGEAVEGARVRELATGATAISAADGSFVLTGLAPGRVSIQARLDELASPPTEVELAADRAPEPVELTLGERQLLRLEIRVADAAGRPAQGAFVFLEEEGSGQRILTAGTDGVATAAVEPPLPARVRAAATNGSAWAFGEWVGWETAQDGLPLALGSGSLVVSAEEKIGSPRIASPLGWDLSWLLTLLGARPAVSPELPLRLDGLPAGSYTVSLDGVQRTVAVQDGEAATAQM